MSQRHLATFTWKRFSQAVVRGLILSAITVVCAGAGNFLSQRAMAAPDRFSDADDGPCDRACLDDFIDQYLAALVTHDPSHLLLAKGVKATETGQLVAPGEGMWLSVDQIGIYRVRFDDPVAGEAGIIALTDEHGLPGVLALRLKIQERKISEIESIIVRQDIQGQGGMLTTSTMFAVTPIAPLDRKWFLLPDPALLTPIAPAGRTSREKMLAAAEAYFDGLEKNSSAGVPMDASCIRRDNGLQTTNNPNPSPVDPAFPSFKIFGLECATQLDSHYYSVISKVRGRRYPIVDEERGLVYAIVLFDHPGYKRTVDVPGVGAVSVPPAYRSPSSFIVPVIFKIRDGKILRIETLERAVPYGMPSGWN
jgi:hypothetical protein